VIPRILDASDAQALWHDSPRARRRGVMAGTTPYVHRETLGP
jgi:hypothetical protein